MSTLSPGMICEELPDTLPSRSRRPADAGDLRVDRRGVARGEVVAVNCCPGKISIDAARPLRY
jgi:hypothetical protein